MKQGEIYHITTPQSYGYRHSFVFWEDNCNGTYMGVMLTHSDQNTYADNIPLEDRHFEPGYNFQNEKTHFVQCMLIKDISADELDKRGELTLEGIEYIESHKSNMKIDTWRGYLQKNKP